MRDLDQNMRIYSSFLGGELPLHLGGLGEAGELVPVGRLLETKGLPAADRITGFYVGSVSLVDFLVRWKKEKAFTTFLRDCQRYGTAAALKRNYSIDGLQALEAGWKQSAIDTARGQKP